MSMKVESTNVEGDVLYVELSSGDREELVSRGRKFALEFAASDTQFAKWAAAGVEKASSPIPFDPKDPTIDPYKPENAKRGSPWHYRQTVKLTRSPI